MRIFLAGAAGAIGRQLVPQLIAAGHQVTGTTRSARRAEELRQAGAEPAVVDALDAAGLRQAVVAARPDAVINQLTAIPARLNPRTFARDFRQTNRLRTEATRVLLDAAKQAGAGQMIAQSVSFLYAPGPPGTIHSEADPLIDAEKAPSSVQPTVTALRELEQATLQAGGIVLRYGYFYGPFTSFAGGGPMAADARRRRLPVVGRGTGVWSFIHTEDAAAATVAALSHDGPATFNIVDDEPAPVARWLPAFAKAVGAPRPMRVPAFIARLLVGGYGVEVMTRAQGASAALAKQQLAWQPRHPSWREGFRSALG